MIFWPLLIAGNALSLCGMIHHSRSVGLVFPIFTLLELLTIVGIWIVVNVLVIFLHLVMR